MINHLIIPLLMLLIINCSYPGKRNFFSVEEKTRPLSLPPNMTNMNIGLEFHYGMESDTFDLKFDGDLMNYQFPYLSIDNNTALLLLPPMLVFHLMKNITVQDSVISSNGPNLALLAGINNILYSPDDGFGLSFGIGYQLKTDIGKNAWFFSNCLGSISDNFYRRGMLTLGTGFQITKRFAILLSLKNSLYDYIVHFTDIEATETYRGYSVKVPIDFKFNLNRKYGFMFRTGFVYETNKYDNKPFRGGIVGIQYSVYW